MGLRIVGMAVRMKLKHASIVSVFDLVFAVSGGHSQDFPGAFQQRLLL